MPYNPQGLTSVRQRIGGMKAAKIANREKRAKKKKASSVHSVQVSRDLVKAVQELALVRSKMPLKDAEDPAIKEVLMRRMLGAFQGGTNVAATFKARLPMTPLLLVTNAGGLLGASGVAYGCQPSQISGFSQWQTVFAEMRPVRAEFRFQPAMCNAATGADNGFAAGVDYDSAVSTPGSLAAVLQSDDPQVIGMGETKPHVWHVNLSKLFGEVWNDTNTFAGTWCRLMAFSTGTGSASVSYGYIWGFVDLEFRGFA